MNPLAIILDFLRVKKTDGCLGFMTALFAVCVVVANVAAAKVCSFSVFEFDAGILAYPITFLCIDLINEIWGPKYARRAVLTGVSLQLVAFALFLGAINLPSSPFVTDFAEQFATVIGMGGRVAIASVVSFLVAQLLDVKLFQFFKLRFGPKWIRSSGSSIISQIADSTIFTIIAFAGVIPDLWIMIMTSYLVKIVTSFAVTPFFYFFSRKGADK